MFDTGSSLSWIQTTGCLDSPTLCNNSPKFNASSSTTIRFQPEKIAVRYTEGVISTQVVSDVVTLGMFSTAGSSNSTVLSRSNSTASATTISAAATTPPPPPPTTKTKTKTTTATTTSRGSRNTSYPHTTMGSTNNTSRATAATAITRDETMKETNDQFRSIRSFGLTTDVSGDLFLLTKETDVSGFLGASQNRFESESDFSTHFFADMVRELPRPVFSLAFTETWGTLTLGGPDPAFFSEPLSWVKTLPDEAGWVTRLAPRIELIPFVQESSSGGDVDYVITDIDRVWFDSGTTYIWGDESAIRPLNEWIGADPVTGQVDCTSIPFLGNIVFSIGGSDGETELRLELSPTDYIIGKSTSRKCFSALNISSSGKNHWIFGLQLLRGFYTVYHYGYGLVGIDLLPSHTLFGII
ncbi:hypothetical protein EMPS_10711 [Entomortierella parvispora]|uniref:Peptidase A1 domain-containing protein n=1 Tax=Entomortierella parvispora TaxID=205924 RepID=A0A9P3M1L0_9FUNG|nr:hypothetical protein EMPS_10711 [Entomortierella parvispora]